MTNREPWRVSTKNGLDSGSGVRVFGSFPILDDRVCQSIERTGIIS